MHLDLAYLQEVSGGDAEFEQELVATYLESAPSLVACLREAVAQGDGPKALHAAHTLKGSSRSVGATPFGDLCAQIELAARAERFESARGALSALEGSFAALEAEMTALLAVAA